MEALYNRMASSIAQNSSATDRKLVSNVLQFVTCSLRVLTVTELSQALHEDASKMLDFQRSIAELCGGFIVIDNGGNVAMIHQTAREYLLSTQDRPFYVDRNEAHRQIFLSCMRYLTASNLRTKIKSSQKPAFLDYAAQSWSWHLALTPPNCGQAAMVLERFLTSSWVLTWVQALADSGQLRILVQASKHLSRYSVKRNEDGAAQNEQGHHIVREELVKSWAEDFAKLVGKFGTILRRNPESIYKLIPPFCPPNSAIHQQFGNAKDKVLSVSGLSSGNWDDSLARLSFGFGTYASSILAYGSQIAVLISSGSVLLYDSSDFEEATVSPISHGERVYRMELNSTGTLLATYGYLTTKVWEVATGKCKTSVKNIDSRPRPLAMLLTNNNSTLVVGTDDRQIRSLNLNEDSPTWELVARFEEPELEGHFLNSANHMALNKDGSLITVAYRGYPLSAWETDEPVHIAHCWRKREEIARGEVIEAVWHPHDAEVLGLYIEGVVFKWRPYEDEVEELAAGASRLAISRDGNLFATGDVRGTVKVFTTSDFCLLYQLTSEDTVLGLAFSPDLRRFYDIRGHYGNAWEPNVLMKYAEQRGKDHNNSDETRSSIVNTMASENFSKGIDSITILASSPFGRLYCYGTENGTVCLHDTQRGKLADLHTSRSFHSIEQMSWSDDGRSLCFCDSSKQVSILSISTSAGNFAPSVETKARIPMADGISGPILQLLFHPDSSQLLVRSSSTVGIVCLTQFKVTKSLEVDTTDSRWVVHPQHPSLLMQINPTSILLLDWDLVRRESYRLEYLQNDSQPTSPTTPANHAPVKQVSIFQRRKELVERVLVSQDKKHILLQISASSRNSKGKTLLCFETSSCLTSTATTSPMKENGSSTTLTPFILPREKSSQVALALAFLAGNKLVFLSRTFSVCTWRIPFQAGQLTPFYFPTVNLNGTAIATPTAYSGNNSPGDTNRKVEDMFKPLFSLPGDWISRDCLTLCSIWPEERSLLCPRNGELAVIRCSALI